MQDMRSNYRLRLAMACGALLTVLTLSNAQSLTWLGILPGTNQSTAYGVSADGRVVVGASRTTAGLPRAFRWTAQTGMVEITNTLGSSNWSEAFGVSADGSTIVGYALNTAQQERAFRWTEQTGMQELGTLGGNQSRAYAAAATGTIVVGWSLDSNNQARAFRWENNVIQNLGTLGGSESWAYAVSVDGTVIVGTARNASGWRRAFRLQNNAMSDLGTLGGFESEGLGVSADGNFVVGASFTGAFNRAFRWSQQGMQNLGAISFNSAAHGVSVSGIVMVGTSQTGTGIQHAIRWTLLDGLQDLNQVYAGLLSVGSRLSEALAVSPNGRYIVGYGYNNDRRRFEAFLLDSWLSGDTDGDGCIDDGDLLTVLFAFGNQGGDADVNSDGVVDDADLLIVLFNFGAGC
ncbi:MAG: hypothetical protein N2554_00735 [Fimbriimonadales bacterium]|nr:hypothetical protein [Fimbriimonadales bacterium]